jgi:tRNA (mo5U34)-methyltransferase
VTEQQLRQRIEELGPWFHNFRLRGIQTAPDHFLGDYPATHWNYFERVVPKDLGGRSVLDVGCNAGFFSLQAKRRGAGRVLGIDTNQRYLDQARLAATESGLDVEFRRLPVYEVGALAERFDFVLFLGVLYHLRYPLLALDLLHEHVVGEWLLYQTMLRGSDDVLPVEPDYPFAERGIFNQPGFPKLHFIERQYSGDATNWWVPNRAAAEAMLRSAGFEVTEHPVPEVFLCRRIDRAPSADDGDRRWSSRAFGAAGSFVVEVERP